jgi:hypothetical protein
MVVYEHLIHKGGLYIQAKVYYVFYCKDKTWNERAFISLSAALKKICLSIRLNCMSASSIVCVCFRTSMLICITNNVYPEY